MKISLQRGKQPPHQPLKISLPRGQTATTSATEDLITAGANSHHFSHWRSHYSGCKRHHISHWRSHYSGGQTATTSRLAQLACVPFHTLLKSCIDPVEACIVQKVFADDYKTMQDPVKTKNRQALKGLYKTRQSRSAYSTITHNFPFDSNKCLYIRFEFSTIIKM
jgi:hypothetical protein